MVGLVYMHLQTVISLVMLEMMKVSGVIVA